MKIPKNHHPKKYLLETKERVQHSTASTTYIMPIYNLLGTETKRSRICPNACLLINYWLYCSSLSPACWVALACSFVAQWQSTRPREQSVVGLSPTLYDSSYFLEEVFSFACDMRVSGPVNHTQLTEVKVGAPLFGSSNESCFVLYTCWEYLCSLSVMWTILRLAFSRSSAIAGVWTWYCTQAH